MGRWPIISASDPEARSRCCQFAIAADSLGQGYGLRDRIDGSIMDYIALPTGPGGVTQQWTLLAIAFEGLVQRFFEIDPDWEPDRGQHMGCRG